MSDIDNFFAWATQQRGAITTKGGAGSGRYPKGSGEGDAGKKKVTETNVGYHGTTIAGLEKVLSEIDQEHGLYVTDTPERARDYANAKSTSIVRLGTSELSGRSAIVKLRHDKPISFLRRTGSHGTLDTAESVIGNWKVEEVIVRPSDYWNSDQNKILKNLKDKYGDKIKIIGEIPSRPVIKP